MTYAGLAKRIAKRTGYPEKTVRHILDAQLEELRWAIYQREQIWFRGLFKITPKDRTISVQPIGEERTTVERLVLLIRPMRAFRKELNRWTSTVS